MKVWYYGEEKNIEIGDEVFVGHCGSGRTVLEKVVILRKLPKNILFLRPNLAQRLRQSLIA